MPDETDIRAAIRLHEAKLQRQAEALASTRAMLDLLDEQLHKASDKPITKK